MIRKIFYILCLGISFCFLGEAASEKISTHIEQSISGNNNVLTGGDYHQNTYNIFNGVQQQAVFYKLKITFSSFVEVINFLYKDCFCMELQMDMLPPPIYHDKATQTTQDVCMQNELRITFHNPTLFLQDLVGIDPVTSYVKEALSSLSKMMTLYYFCSNRLGLEILQLFEKKEKTKEDITRLSSLFSYTDKGLYPLMCEQHRDKKWRDGNFYAQLRANQIILLVLLDTLKNNQIEDKKPLFDEITHDYKRGLVLIDKVRRFWRDDHASTQGKITTCVNLGEDNLNYIECFIPGKPTTYLTDLYLKIHDRNNKTVIYAEGGVGKSSLAEAYAHEAIKNNGYDFVVWINAENEAGIRSGYIEAIKEYDKSLIADDSIPIKDLIRRLESILRDKLISPLFIFDNAQSHAGVQPYLPSVGHKLITTRMDPNDDGVTSIKLNRFSENEALSYIKRRLGETVKSDHAKALAQKLENHPLALSLACGYITNKRNRTGYKTYLKIFDEKFKQSVSNPDEPDISKSLYASLQLSLGMLNDNERTLLYILCYLPADFKIPQILSSLINEDALQESFNMLEDLSLIVPKRGEDYEVTSTTIHRLTQQVGRMIHERTPEFEPQKSAFFNNIMIPLERRVLDVHNMLSKTLSLEETSVIYDELTNLGIMWETLTGYMTKDPDLTVIDENAYYIRIEQNKWSEKLLAISASPALEEQIIKRQAKLTDEQYEKLIAIYNAHFPHIKDPTHKKQICIKLSKFYDDDFKKYVDWSLFEGLDYDTLSKRLDVLISTTEIKDFDLKVFFGTVQDVIKTFNHDPYLSLVAVRLKPERSVGANYIYDEVVQFMKKLCTKELSASFHRYQHAVSMWVSLPAHSRHILQQLNAYDENGIAALNMFSNIQYAGLMRSYFDIAFQIVGHPDNGKKSALLISGFPCYINFRNDIIRKITPPNIKNEGNLTGLLRENPSLQSIAENMISRLLRPLEPMSYYDGLGKIYDRNPNEFISHIINEYINYIYRLLHNEDSKLARNQVIAFVAMLQHYSFAIEGIGLCSTEDGADDERLLNAYKALMHERRETASKDGSSLERIQQEAQERFPLASYEKVCDVYYAYRIMYRIYGDPNLENIFKAFEAISLDGSRAEDKAVLFEWFYNNPDHQQLMNTIVPLLFAQNYTAEDILEILAFYKKRNVSIPLQPLRQRFEEILPYFSTDPDEKRILAKYIPFVADERLNEILSHPFLRSPISIVPFAHMVLVSATLDTHESAAWVENNPVYKGNKSLFRQFIENPFNQEFYVSYLEYMLERMRTA